MKQHCVSCVRGTQSSLSITLSNDIKNNPGYAPLQNFQNTYYLCPENHAKNHSDTHPKNMLKPAYACY